MLSNAEVDKPVRAPLLALLLLWLLDASADDDVAPRDSSRPAFSGGLSGDSRTWRYVTRVSLAGCLEKNSNIANY